jgi:hypothetical protein
MQDPGYHLDELHKHTVAAREILQRAEFEGRELSPDEQSAASRHVMQIDRIAQRSSSSRMSPHAVCSHSRPTLELVQGLPRRSCAADKSRAEERSTPVKPGGKPLLLRSRMPFRRLALPSLKSFNWTARTPPALPAHS